MELAIGGKYLTPLDIKKMGVTPPEVTDEQRVEAVGKLLDFCMTNADLSQIIASTNSKKETLNEVFETLELNGACYWVGGSYVPVGALVDPYTLSYCLEAKNRDLFNSLVINQVLGYFDGLTKRLLFPDEREKLIKKR